MTQTYIYTISMKEFTVQLMTNFDHCRSITCNYEWLHGILQARVQEWATIPSPGDLPEPEIKPKSPVLQAVSLSSEPPGKLLDD